MEVFNELSGAKKETEDENNFYHSGIYAPASGGQFDDVWGELMPGADNHWYYWTNNIDSKQTGFKKIIPNEDWAVLKPGQPPQDSFVTYSGGRPKVPDQLRPITMEELESLKKGIVPDSIKSNITRSQQKKNSLG